ncbi:methylmalonyl-CoA mutase family protein [Chloroflexota bacterium]
MTSRGAKKGSSGRPQRGVKARIEAEMERWEAGTLADSLAKKPEVRDSFSSNSGIRVKRVYTPLDSSDEEYLKKIGFPGQPPYTRGIEPSGHRTKEEWILNYYSGHGSSEDTNQRFKDLVVAGAGDIWIALDLPTQVGLDSDHPLAEDEVGRAGTALDTLEDMEIMFDGISLDQVQIGVVGNSIGPWFLAMFLALLEKRGADPKKSYLWMQNDPLKEYTGRGTYIFSPEVAVDLAADAVVYSLQHTPRIDPQYACGSHFRVGCNAAQEIGFGIAHLICFIEAAQKKGAKLEQLVPRLNIHGGTFDDFFEEIAKFRAQRRLWAKIARARFKTDDPRVLAIRQSTYTQTRLTAQQPLNNIVRTTAYVLASLFAGVEHILAPSHDEALALPTFESTRLASLTKNILHCECFVDNTVDPLGGSYYVESLTDQLEAKGREWFEKIEAAGGPLAAIANDYYQHELGDGIYKLQKSVESGEKVVIGVNKFNLDEEAPPKIFRTNPEAERKQVTRLQEVKKRRNDALVTQCLTQLRKVAEEKAAGRDSNIMFPILDAVRAYASIGEIYGVLRKVFGEYKPWTTKF